MGTQRLNQLKRFCSLIESLNERIGGARCLSECTGKLDWPRRGVYFVMEDGESRTDTGGGRRIVRVGTHALKSGARTTLWNRLSQHRGSEGSGGGNHRGSIFRLIIGTALIQRDGHECPSWDNRKSTVLASVRAGERALEREVSKTIGAMHILWLPVQDEPGQDSERGYIERNAIALLSNFGKEAIDPPSPGWLGHHCSRQRVRASGLWNANHVDETHDPVFLDRLEQLVNDCGSDR